MSTSNQGVGAEVLASDIVARVESLLLDAERTTRPLELAPYREQLFELFVMAEASGFLAEDAEPDLAADAISHRLAQKWELASVAQDSIERQEKLSSESLARLRMLWSFLRMWMEWTYAWGRWSEFHEGDDLSAPSA